jgi:hypothetical protein
MPQSRPWGVSVKPNPVKNAALCGQTSADALPPQALFLDAYANATFAMDDAIFLHDEFNRPGR